MKLRNGLFLFHFKCLPVRVWECSLFGLFGKFATLSQNWSQWRLGRPRFSAFQTVCLFLLCDFCRSWCFSSVLIGWCDYFALSNERRHLDCWNVFQVCIVVCDRLEWRQFTWTAGVFCYVWSLVRFWKISKFQSRLMQRKGEKLQTITSAHQSRHADYYTNIRASIGNVAYFDDLIYIYSQKTAFHY